MAWLKERQIIQWIARVKSCGQLLCALGSEFTRQELLFDQQQPALPVAVEGIYGVEQTWKLPDVEKAD